MDKKNHLLSMRGVSKSFPGVQALENIDFDINEGEVRALVGENGAGKSTLMKIIYGAEQPTSGQMSFKGEQVNFSGPKNAHEFGISMVHQELSLVDSVSVAENVFLGHLPRTKPFNLIDWGQLFRRTEKIFDELDINIDPKKKVGHLGAAEKQIIEIAKAVSHQNVILILDEPGLALTEEEKEKLFKLVNRLCHQKMAIIYISHTLEDVFEIADTVTVLRDAEKIGDFQTKNLDQGKLVGLMIGEGKAEGSSKRVSGNTPNKKILELENISTISNIKNVSFELSSNQILGIHGLIGSGFKEIGKVLFGLKEYKTGQIEINGKERQFEHPIDAVEAGIGYFPEFRSESLVPSLTVAQNITLSSLRDIYKYGVLQPNEEKKIAQNFVNSLNIETPSLEQKVSYLSGGNQQKAAIAKWLCRESSILILDEPTHGIDVGAKEEVINLIYKLAQQGVGIILITTEVSLLLRLCDNFIVMYKGEVQSTFTRDNVSREKLIKSANGEVIPV